MLGNNKGKECVWKQSKGVKGMSTISRSEEERYRGSNAVVKRYCLGEISEKELLHMSRADYTDKPKNRV